MPIKQLPPLTRRVLQAFAEGHTTPSAAAWIGIAPTAVDYHLRRARQLLGARTTTQSIALAIVTQQIEVQPLAPGELNLFPSESESV